jgi:hypothetical protein
MRRKPCNVIGDSLLDTLPLYADEDVLFVRKRPSIPCDRSGIGCRCEQLPRQGFPPLANGFHAVRKVI